MVQQARAEVRRRGDGGLAQKWWQNYLERCLELRTIQEVEAAALRDGWNVECEMEIKNERWFPVL